jgi:transcription termination factor NusB
MDTCGKRQTRTYENYKDKEKLVDYARNEEKSSNKANHNKEAVTTSSNGLPDMNWNSLHCYYTNIQSIKNKLSELHELLENTETKIIGLTESWTTMEMFDGELDIPGYNMYRSDRMYGGTILYIHQSLISRRCHEMDMLGFNDSVWCIISLKRNHELLIGVCYRSPNSPHDNNKKLFELLKKASKMKTSHLLLMGDFNFPQIDFDKYVVSDSDESSAQVFFDCIQDLFLIQHVKFSTRIRHGQRPSLLDLVFTNEIGMVVDLKEMPPIAKSDHIGISWSLVVEADDQSLNTNKLDYWKGNFLELEQYLAQINWDEELKAKEVMQIEEAWNKFRKLLEKGIERFIPRMGTSKRKKKTLSLPNTIKQHIKLRNKQWKKYKQSNSDADWETYKFQRNQVKSRMRAWEDETEKERVRGFKGNKKKFYGYVKSKQVVKQSAIYVKNHINELTKNESETAEVFNQFFSSVFVNEGSYDSNIEECRSTIKLSNIEICDEDVLQQLERLQVNKSHGPDQISPHVLKNCKEALCHPLALLYNKSLHERKLPKEWKLANITPIHKGGDKADPGNYRPVSLTSVPCKIMEALIFKKVKGHLQEIGVPSSVQHGFVERRSCLTNLLISLEEWTKAVDEGSAVDIVYLDISKAFDSVPHKRLIEKMAWYGLDGDVLGWLSDFVLERKMRVSIRGNYSGWSDVTSSVPQGSVGGPTQFCLFIDDMSEGITSRIIQFADDTKLWRVIRSPEDRDALQGDINILELWSDKWLLRFNPKKSKILHIGSDNLRYDYEMNSNGARIQLNETKLEKDLGVLVSYDLKVAEQCNQAAKKAMRVLGMINRSFRNLDEELLKMLYCTYVRPHLEYCIQAWSPYLKKDISTLEKVQRRASKLCRGLRKLPYEVRLSRLKLYPLEQRRLRGDLIQAYKILTGKERVDPDIFFKRATTTNLRGNSLKLFKFRSRLVSRQNFFSQRVVNYWNALPESVVEAKSTNAFKNLLDKQWKLKKWELIKAEGL